MALSILFRTKKLLWKVTAERFQKLKFPISFLSILHWQNPLYPFPGGEMRIQASLWYLLWGMGSAVVDGICREYSRLMESVKGWEMGIHGSCLY